MYIHRDEDTMVTWLTIVLFFLKSLHHKLLLGAIFGNGMNSAMRLFHFDFGFAMVEVVFIAI